MKRRRPRARETDTCPVQPSHLQAAVHSSVQTMHSPFPQNCRHSPQARVRARYAAAIDLLQPQSSITMSPSIHLQPPTFIIATFSCVIALVLTGVATHLVHAHPHCIALSSSATSPCQSYVCRAALAFQSHRPNSSPPRQLVDIAATLADQTLATTTAHAVSASHSAIATVASHSTVSFMSNRAHFSLAPPSVYH